MINSDTDRWVTSFSAKNKRKSEAKVAQNILYVAQADKFISVCRVDSPEWFVWLDTATVFRYQSTASIPTFAHYSYPALPISVRKETRRNGHFWYAYLRYDGYLYKRYVGKSSALTAVRLDEVAVALSLC